MAVAPVELKQVVAYVPEEIRAKLAEAATVSRRTLSAEIGLALEAWLEKKAAA